MRNVSFTRKELLNRNVNPDTTNAPGYLKKPGSIFKEFYNTKPIGEEDNKLTIYRYRNMNIFGELELKMQAKPGSQLEYWI